MSDGEERVEAFPDEFGDESVENRPSHSWSEVEADPSQESPSDSEETTRTPILLSPSCSAMMPTTTIDSGDGVLVEISATPRTTQVTSLGGIMFRKEDRAQLSMEKRTELFDKIVMKSLESKFNKVSISLTDVEKLDDTYNVAMLVDRARDHCIKYDLHGVFNIVDVSDPETNPTIDKALGSLFVSYSTITEEEVARSNEWYRHWAISDEYENNLRLSMDFLERNTSDSLWEKCLEAHNMYPLVQHGGPLIFIIMMKKIQYDTEDAVRYLQESVKKMKLTNFDGENACRQFALWRRTLFQKHYYGRSNGFYQVGP